MNSPSYKLLTRIALVSKVLIGADLTLLVAAKDRIFRYAPRQHVKSDRDIFKDPGVFCARPVPRIEVSKFLYHQNSLLGLRLKSSLVGLCAGS